MNECLLNDEWMPTEWWMNAYKMMNECLLNDKWIINNCLLNECQLNDKWIYWMMNEW